MICEETFELLSAQLDGELSEEEALQLNEHLSRCESCQTLSAELSALRAVLPDAVEITPPPELAQSVLKNLPPRKKQRSILRFPLRYGSLVAALVLLITSSVYFLSNESLRVAYADPDTSADTSVQDTPALAASTETDAAGGIPAYDPAPQSLEITGAESAVSESGAESAETVISHDLRRSAAPEKNARSVADADTAQRFFAVLTISSPQPPQSADPYPQENGDEWYYLSVDAFDSYLQDLESQDIGFQLEEGDPDQTTALVIVTKS